MDEAARAAAGRLGYQSIERSVGGRAVAYTGATVAFARMVRRLVLGEGMPACREEVARLIEEHRAFRFEPYRGQATAYVVDTVQTVLHHFFRTGGFERCVVDTVNQGGDADTTGAIGGMLAGALYGPAAIPASWLSRLDAGVKREIETQVPALLTLAGIRAT